MATDLSSLVLGEAPAPQRSLAKHRRDLAPVARQAASALALVLIWQGLSTFLFSPSLLPSPLMVAGRAAELAWTGELFRHLGTSLGRIVVGYVLGAAAGVVAGVLIGRVRWCEDLVSPTLNFVRSIPPIALVPLSIIVLGIGESSKYAIIIYLVFIVVTLNTATGVRETPIIRIRAAQALGARGAAILWRVVVPSAFPFVLTGLQVGLGLGFMAVVSAELIDARNGLGYLIMDSQNTLETDRMLVGILCLGVLGALVDRGAHRLAARMLRRYTQHN